MNQTAVTSNPLGSTRLVGAPNFRDMGGYEAAGGRRVSFGKLYRSDKLSRLTTEDLATIEALGIELICDLRGPNERQSHPTRWHSPHNTEWLLLNIDVDFRGEHSALRKVLRDDPTPRGAHQMMMLTYRLFPAAIAPGMGTYLRRLADLPGATLIHCTAGKDRTGFLSACLLHVLGVPETTIYEDYMLTRHRLDVPALMANTRELMTEICGFEPEEETLRALLGVDPAYLEASFAEINSSYGSLDRYLEEAVGVDAELRAALQARLTE